MKKVFVILAASLIAAFSAQAETTTQELINKGKAAYASSSPRAIGLRLGYGVSLTYQQQVGANMVSIDLDSPGFVGFGLAVTYDWLNPFNTQVPWNKKGLWNWYLGVGLGASAFIHNETSEFIGGIIRHDNNFNFAPGVVGRVGIEYEFWFPLQLALEYRPTVGVMFNNYTHYLEDVNHNKSDKGGNNDFNFYTGGLFASAITLCVRYKF